AHGIVTTMPSLTQCDKFGRNGSYLVLRQIEQDVPEFWRFMRQNAKSRVAAARLASKIVGRERDGTPLVPNTNRDDNEFGFAEDPYGYGCPIGSHMRRANPRNGFANNSEPAAVATTANRNRILRRGRPYGPRIDDPRAPAEAKRGLMFL